MRAVCAAQPHTKFALCGVALDVIELNRVLTGLKNDIIKVVKRIMYGRCGFELLRSKCLLLQKND